MIRVGERFSRQVTLTHADIAAHASAVGDTNPLHHDVEQARASRCGGIIASGPHTMGLLLGLTAAHFSKSGPMLGLEFWVRFRRPILAGEHLRLEWLVIRARASAKIRGQIVELRGRIQGQDGTTAVGAKGIVLVEAAP
jgi:3-hydroxybutyryl-CoA dehydratase